MSRRAKNESRDGSRAATPGKSYNDVGNDSVRCRSKQGVRIEKVSTSRLGESSQSKDLSGNRYLRNVINIPEYLKDKTGLTTAHIGYEFSA